MPGIIGIVVVVVIVFIVLVLVGRFKGAPLKRGYTLSLHPLARGLIGVPQATASVEERCYV